jgi:hypothetical protein
MPTAAEIRAELDRRTKQAPAQPAPVVAPPSAVEAIRDELTRRGVSGSGMRPVNPMVAEGRAMVAAAAQASPTMSPVRPEARGDVALRTTTLTLPPQRGPVMSPMQREAMAPERAEADRQRKLAEERREASRAYGGGMDFVVGQDDAGNLQPGLNGIDKDVGKTLLGAPLQFGQGLAEGGANIINNLTGIAAEGVNTANKFLLGDKAYQFSGTNIQVPRNVIVDEGGALSSVGGIAPRVAGQFMAARVPLGKALPKGGVGADIAKDALSLAATTDKNTPRLSDLLPAGMLDGLRKREGEGYTEAFMKNALEDSVISAAATGLLKLAGRVMDGPAPKQAASQQAGTSPRGTLTPVASSLSPAERKALDLVIRKLEADGVTIDEVVKTAAALGRKGDSGVYETLAEIVALTGKSSGANTRGLAMAGGAVPGPTQQALVGRVKENTNKLPDRLSRAATRATGQSADNAVGTLDELEKRLRTEAAPAYDDAYATPVDPKVFANEIVPVLNTPSGKKALQAARNNLASVAADLQARAARGADERSMMEWNRARDAVKSIDDYMADPVRGTAIPTTMALDYTKRAFDDVIADAGFGSDTARIVGGTKRNFADSVSQATGGKYGNALGVFEDVKRLEDAFAVGTQALNKKTWELERELAKGRGGSPWTAGEIESIAMGVARNIEDLIEANNQSALTKLLKDKALKNIATALGSEKAANTFEQSIRRLAANREFGVRVAGGSDTAMRQAAIRDAGVEGEDVVTKGLDAVERGNIPFSLQSVADASFRAGARKAKEAYRYFRYPGLYDEDVNKALAPIISEPMTETRRNALASSIKARQAERGQRNALNVQASQTPPALTGPPTNALASSGIGRAIGGGIVGGMAGGLVGEADGQTTETAQRIADNKGQTQAILADIAKIESDMRVYEGGDPLEMQKTLNRRSTDGSFIQEDGSIGPETTAAIGRDKTAAMAALKEKRERLAQLELTGKELEQQAAFERTRPTEDQQAFRDYAPLLGGIAGAAGAKLARIGGTTVSKFTAKSAIKNANALLSNAPISPPKTVADRTAIRERATSLNEFWQLGGSKTNVPFETKRDGTWIARPPKDVTPPAALFPDKFIGRKVGAADALIGGSAATEATLAGQNAEIIKEKLVVAYETAKDDPSEKNLARVQELEDQYAQAKGLMMLGIGAGIGTGIGVMTSKYASKRANVPMAEQELAILRQYFASQKKPPVKAPPPVLKNALSNPPLPPSRPRRTQRPPNP